MKATNERKMDITPLREHALSLRNKIYQVQVKIVGDDYRIKKVEARLQEISVISTEFKARTHEILETIQGQLTWLETNKEFPENAHMKSPERLHIEYDTINFSNKIVERLIVVVKNSIEKCTQFYKKMHQVHNKCQLSSVTKVNGFADKDQHMVYLQDRLREDEQNI